MTRIWWILIQALKSLKLLNIDWSFLCKVNITWPTKVQTSYLSWNWRVMQNLNKNWLVVWKMTWEKFGKFSSEHSKVSKLRLWWYRFLQRRKCMNLKFTGYLCVMTMENDAQFEEEFTRQFKTDTRNLTNFHPSLQKSQKFARIYVWWHWILMQNLKENWLVLSGMSWWIWQIFTRALKILKIGILMWSLSPK